MILILLANSFMNCLLISGINSIIVMTLIQRLKTLSFVSTNNHILILDIILSFAIGIPFTLTFYQLDLIYAFWISILSFIGAPAIYTLLKEQTIINYTPKSLDDLLINNDNKDV